MHIYFGSHPHHHRFHHHHGSLGRRTPKITFELSNTASLILVFFFITIFLGLVAYGYYQFKHTANIQKPVIYAPIHMANNIEKETQIPV